MVIWFERVGSRTQDLRGERRPMVSTAPLWLWYGPSETPGQSNPAKAPQDGRLIKLKHRRFVRWLAPAVTIVNFNITFRPCVWCEISLEALTWCWNTDVMYKDMYISKVGSKVNWNHPSPYRIPPHQADDVPQVEYVDYPLHCKTSCLSKGTLHSSVQCDTRCFYRFLCQVKLNVKQSCQHFAVECAIPFCARRTRFNRAFGELQNVIQPLFRRAPSVACTV
jgi:hypothetical protein